MTKYISAALTTLTILFLTALTGYAEDPESTPSASRYEAEAYMKHLRYLASDEVGGRLPGTPGGTAATEYIAQQFKKIGLKPAGVDGTYFQPFTIRKLKTLHNDRASFSITGLDQEWKIRRDWIPMPFSKPGRIKGPLAFAGYGIAADKHEYNDYADFDAKGKVLLILRNEPLDEDPDADFGGETPSRYALFSKKALTAAEKGAKALLIVNGYKRNPDRDELYPWHDWHTNQSYSLPIVHISREIAEALLSEAGRPDLKSLQDQLDRERKPLSTDLEGLQANIKTGLKFVKGRNVIGLLEGTESDEVIVLGAHHDHLGKVPPRTGETPEPQIHNGADDDASGTSAIIELARVFASGPKPRRGILFMTFDGEELGLLGSRHFVDEPTVELEKIRAMINFDMIGRLGNNQFTIFGTGSGKEFRPLLKKAAENLDISYHAPSSDTRFMGGADHFSFYVKDIPVMFAFTGMHAQFHLPTDDWELIDDDGAVKIMRLMHPVIAELANLTTGPVFVPKDEEAEEPAEETETPMDADQETDTDKADDDAYSTRRINRGELKVRIGIIPDSAFKGSGLRAASVIDKTPAAAAGMRDGDTIISIAGKAVSDIQTYVAAVRSHNPGDTVEVVIKRESKELTLKVKLEKARKRP